MAQWCVDRHSLDRDKHRTRCWGSDAVCGRPSSWCWAEAWCGFQGRMSGRHSKYGPESWQHSAWGQWVGLPPEVRTVQQAGRARPKRTWRRWDSKSNEIGIGREQGSDLWAWVQRTGPARARRDLFTDLELQVL